MSNAIQRLAARLEGVERNLRAMSTPQLGNSSVEDGGAIGVNAEDGTEVMSLGGQYDGTFAAATLVGPKPPTPNGLTVIPEVGGLRVRWAGTFEADAIVPMDWSRAEIHASTTNDFSALTATTLYGTFETPRGGEVFIALPPALHYVKLVGRSLAGIASTASAQASGTPVGPVTDADLTEISQAVSVAQEAADDAAAAVALVPGQIATAKDEALVSAATDAQNKADLAKAEALAAAATDAQTKATAAQTAAISSAATTAQSKADLAQATAINSAKDYVQARGTNLVTNGTGQLGDNTNFSMMTFTKADAPIGIAGSFVTPLGVGQIPTTDEFLPVDPSKKARLSFYARQTGTTAAGYAYAFVYPHDAFKQPIDPGHVMFVAGTTTTLAAPLNPGDTTMTINTPATPWYGSAGKAAGASVHLRRAIFWDYVDAGGKAWPQETYSRNVTATNFWADGAITGNVITLSAPYSGTAKAAGTKLSNGSSGGTYMYGALVNGIVPKTWTRYGESLVGVMAGGVGASFASGWPPGTAFAKVGFLANRTVTGPPDALSQHAFAGISFGDAEAAAYDANNITEVQITTDAITAPKVKAGAIIAGKIATDAVQANNIEAGAVIAGKLAANAVVASNIAANTITADRLRVGDMSNMATVDGDPAGASQGGMTYALTTGVDGKSNWVTRNGTKNIYFMFRPNIGPVPLKAGDRIRMTFEGYVASGSAPFTPYVLTYGGTGGNINFNLAAVAGAPATTLTTTPQTFVAEGVVPATVTDQVSYMVGINGANLATLDTLVRNVRAHRMNAGELLVDGSILAGKLAADSVVATNIKAGEITAAKMAAGTITAASGVVGDLDASTLRSGTIDAARLAAGSISAGHLSSVVAVVSKLCSSENGRRWEADQAGIRVYDTDGTLLVNFPTDPDTPASFAGDLVATSLTVSDQLAIRGLVNEISKGAQVVLAGGTTAPSSPPGVVIDWEYVTTDSKDIAYDQYKWGGAVYNDRIWMAQNLYGGASGFNAFRLSDGVFDWGATAGWNYANLINITSVTIIGSTMYALGVDWTNSASDGFYYVEGYNLANGTRLSRWKYPHVFGTSGTAHRKPFVSNDGTNLVIAFTNFSDNKLQYRKYVPSTGVQVGSTVISPNATFSREITAFHYTSADFGAPRAVGVFAGVDKAYVMNGTDLNYLGVDGGDFYLPAVGMHGLVWDPATSRFVSYDYSSGRFYRHTAITWPSTESSMWHTSATWYDGDATGGTHETAQGPRKSFTMKRRARLQVTTPPLPLRPIPNTTDDAKAARVYIGRGSSDPGRTKMELQSTLPDGSRNITLTAVTLPVGAALAVTQPPGTSNFPLTSPGRIVSSDETSIIINGDGSGAFGGLSVVPGGETNIKGLQTTGSYTRTRSPGVMVRKTDTPTIPNATYTLVNWSGHYSGLNSDNTVWSTASPSRFYAPVTGRYAIAGTICFNTNATGYRIVAMRKNSAGSITGGNAVLTWTTSPVPGTVTTLVCSLTDLELTSGDYLEFFASQASGAALGVGSFSGVTSTLSMSYVGNL